jgi:glycogen debranching enzyme
MVTFDLATVPFSRRGSYLALSQRSATPGILNGHAGLFLRSLRGGRPEGAICRLVVLLDGQETDALLEATPTEVCLSTPSGSIRVCFADERTILLKGEGEGIGIRLDDLGNGVDCNFVAEIRHLDRIHYMANCYKIPCRLAISPQVGSVEVSQDWQDDFSPTCSLEVHAREGSFLFSIEEVAVEWRGRGITFDYEDSLRSCTEEFNDFRAAMPTVEDAYTDTARMACYVLWSSVVAKSGFLTRDTIFMSKNWMDKVWSWDHCFNAMALAKGHPDLAWDQFMVLFDHQDGTGVIPDSLHDSGVDFSFCKPPIHGWALLRMLEDMSPSLDRILAARDHLARWTEWWLAFRDGDRDGICEYYHGNDSGWDNSTAFRTTPTMELPDLSAYLVLQMEALAVLSRKIGDEVAAERWRVLSESTLDAMLARFFDDNGPHALTSQSHEIVDNESLILFLPVILGKRLPERIRNRLVDALKSDRFLTPHGFATESPSSPLYASDGYWRGPIWAPVTFILIDGLVRCGETDFAREVARRFCDMCVRSGFSENYDAISGKGQRDRAYTWSASVFLFLARRGGLLS